MVHHRCRFGVLRRVRPGRVRPGVRRRGLRRDAVGIERPLPPDGAAVPAPDRGRRERPRVGRWLRPGRAVRPAGRRRRPLASRHPEYAFADVVYGPLCDLVGGAVARELCMTGRNVDGRRGARAPPGVGGGRARRARRKGAGGGARRSPSRLAPNLMRTKAKALRAQQHATPTGSRSTSERPPVTAQPAP